MMETVGYYLITFSAGHDTTKNALVGGMRAFLENPDQFEKLKQHPERSTRRSRRSFAGRRRSPHERTLTRTTSCAGSR